MKKKKSNPSVSMRDLKASKNPKGGLLLPAVQKVRESAARIK